MFGSAPLFESGVADRTGDTRLISLGTYMLMLDAVLA